MQFQDCVNSQIACNIQCIHCMCASSLSLVALFLVCILYPLPHPLIFHPCACPLSPPLVPFLPSSLTCPSIFTILAPMLFLPTCPDLLSSLPSPHSRLPSFSLHILTRSHSLISSKSVFSSLFPHSDRDACERS